MICNTPYPAHAASTAAHAPSFAHVAHEPAAPTEGPDKQQQDDVVFRSNSLLATSSTTHLLGNIETKSYVVRNGRAVGTHNPPPPEVVDANGEIHVNVKAHWISLPKIGAPPVLPLLPSLAYVGGPMGQAAHLTLAPIVRGSVFFSVSFPR